MEERRIDPWFTNEEYRRLMWADRIKEPDPLIGLLARYGYLNYANKLARSSKP